MRKKLLCIILTLAVALSAGACAKQAGPDVSAPVDDGMTVAVNDFEDYVYDFAPMTIAYSFGRVFQNTDKKYVYSGDSSARLEVMGINSSNNSKPVVVLPFNMEHRGVAVTDFTDVSVVEVHLYNAYTRDIDVSLKLKTGVTFPGTLSPSAVTTLKAGAWTTATFSVDRAALELLLDISDVNSLFIEFPTADEIGAGESYTVYLDSMKVYKTDKDYDPITVASRTDDMIIDFETYPELLLSTPAYWSLASPAYMVDISLSPLHSRSGNALKVVHRGSMVNGSTVLDHDFYIGVQFDSKLIAASRLSTMKEGDTFALDVYNDSYTRLRAYFNLGNADKTLGKDDNVYFEPRAWTTVTFTYDELTKGEAASTPERPLRGEAGTISEIEFFNYYIRYDNIPEGTYTIYIDNVRIIRG